MDVEEIIISVEVINEKNHSANRERWCSFLESTSSDKKKKQFVQMQQTGSKSHQSTEWNRMLSPVLHS